MNPRQLEPQSNVNVEVSQTCATSVAARGRKKPQAIGGNRTGCGNAIVERGAIIAEACGISYAEADAIAYATEFDPDVDPLLARVLP